MKAIPLFLFISTASMATGCSAISQVKDLMSQLGGIDLNASEGEREDVNRELFETAIDLINQKNYFMTYSTTVSNIPISFDYEIENNIAKVGQNYYDYSDCDTHPDYAWEYIYDSENHVYTKQQQDLTRESKSSKLIVREFLNANDYLFNDQEGKFEMIEAKLASHNFQECYITPSGNENNLIVYFDITEQQQNSVITCSARLYNFGHAHVELPSNFIEN